MYVIKMGSDYFDGIAFSGRQKDAKRFHSASTTFRDYATLLFGDARFVKLVPKVRDTYASDMRDDYDNDLW